MLQIDPEDIIVEASFSKDLGADSLELYQIVMLVEDTFQIELEQSMKDVKVETVGELIDKINENLRQG